MSPLIKTKPSTLLHVPSYKSLKEASFVQQLPSVM